MTVQNLVDHAYLKGAVGQLTEAIWECGYTVRGFLIFLNRKLGNLDFLNVKSSDF